jgi:hypothetical protein
MIFFGTAEGKEDSIDNVLETFGYAYDSEQDIFYSVLEHDHKHYL